MTIMRAPAVVSLLAALGAVFAQSTDLKHPTPLGPGVNKGNVDNVTGSHYYYVTVGPGHFDVKMAFKEMGVFGNPLRQGLTFDFLSEKGEMVSHNAVVSQGKIERSSTTGDLPKAMKVILAIKPQTGAIRMGGYYEVEIIGAATFDGKGGANAGVKPEDTSLYHPGGALTGGPVALTGQPQTLTAQPQALTVSEAPAETHVVLAADALFEADSAVIRAQAKPVLHHAADLVRQKAHGAVVIEGRDGNPALSKQRAFAVQAWLVANEGFPRTAFTVRGLGASRPGRVELIITK
jgi:outer membrane protein OmpA-like peptidoglycan-associated protein